MIIQQNISLKNYNTFGIDVLARKFVDVTTIEDLQAVIAHTKDLFLIGGGSNMLLTKDIDQLVVHLNIKGIRVVEKASSKVIISAAAGENWHDFVMWCIDNDFGGLENLSLIPGNVGTAPIQNIGAYGVEIKDRLIRVEALEIATGALKTFTNEDCKFGYRDSVFKNEYKGKYILTKVFFELSTENHQFNTSYGAITNYLDSKKGIDLRAVSNAVIDIRNSKLPDPGKLGNSGSFFKNPVVHIDIFDEISKNYKDVPSYKVSENEVKIPAGWLIEQCGFKGMRYGDAGVHKDQALVLVNHGNATGSELLNLAHQIKKTVKDTFGIQLEFEVNIF